MLCSKKNLNAHLDLLSIPKNVKTFYISVGSVVTDFKGLRQEPGGRAHVF